MCSFNDKMKDEDEEILELNETNWQIKPAEDKTIYSFNISGRQVAQEMTNDNTENKITDLLTAEDEIRRQLKSYDK